MSLRPYLLQVSDTKDANSRIGIPTHSKMYNTYAMSFANSVWGLNVPADGDIVVPMSIDLQTYGAPLDVVLREAGSLQIIIGDTQIVAIPVALLGTLPGSRIHYEKNRLQIAFDATMFVDEIPLIRLGFHKTSLQLQSLSSEHITSVHVVLCYTHMETALRRELAMSHLTTHTIQQIQTAYQRDNISATTFDLQTLTKGFFLEGALCDISSVQLTMSDGSVRWLYTSAELFAIGKQYGPYTYIPFHHGADIIARDHFSFIGAFCNKSPVQLAVTYNVPKYNIPVYALCRNEIQYASGMCAFSKL